MSQRLRNLSLGFIVALVVVGCGALEDWFGRTDYAEDAISYLDIFHAIERGDWSLALNPQWSIGYPLILAGTRWMFPSGPGGEWTAIHVVNLAVFVTTYLSFLDLLQVIAVYLARLGQGGPRVTKNGGNAFVFGLGTCLFLLWQLLIGNVSRVSPDPLICCMFFLVVATCLRFFMRPSARVAVVLGLLMGLGYLLKAGFLPASFFILLVMLLHLWMEPAANRWAVLSKLAWALPAVILVALPYVTALSQVVGTFTLGQSAAINYAWNVNQLPQSCDWQGGPAPFGMPVHPTHLVLRSPPVFTFGEPFPVTYPPWYNIPYWYDGYHQFFSIRNQLSAIRYNQSVFRSFFFGGSEARTLLAGLALVTGLCLLKDRRIWWKRLVALWPLVLMAIGPIGIYLLVHIEPRYVIGPLLVLVVTPLLPLFLPTPLVSKRVAYLLLTTIAVGSAVVLANDKRDVVHRIIHGETYARDPMWRLGCSLAQIGVHPGDKVAAVGAGPSLDATWAYVGGVHIVAEIGNDAFDVDNQEKDLQFFANNPEVQRTVFHLFRQAGAVLVVARDLDHAPQGRGWGQIPGSSWWIHHLGENDTSSPARVRLGQAN